MKFLTLASCFIATVATVTAQLTAPMKNYNVTSPVSNGPYVVGQILPCTYRLFQDIDSSMLSLKITLEPATNAPPGTPTNASSVITIADNADVSKTDASAKRDGNTTFYEHSINYRIPDTVVPGNYKVVFKDMSTNTDLPVPISIRPAAQASSSSPAGSAATPSKSGSIFTADSAAIGVSESLTMNTILALAVVAGVALML
ncbi:uncharacterized protein BYT42DRAFT_569027 [Radiomyces spectabilis]|uniref:uncharacterized protein n=1 Tax=Radiomyces spectabilis TaxID=64574 RepID=UPI0022206701|nr:uncharacterized protein BYT42DRAFT_569027 [Radiomyces spectabilis]KAI8379515.1 hypothetical protein BYT42DRAFT_569027 [Radiomyces spectabilis]